MARSFGVIFYQSDFETYFNVERTKCTTHVCTIVSGQVVFTASGSPFNPSQHKMQMSATANNGSACDCITSHIVVDLTAGTSQVSVADGQLHATSMSESDLGSNTSLLCESYVPQRKEFASGFIDYKRLLPKR
jgi:hypothetical protein